MKLLQSTLFIVLFLSVTLAKFISFKGSYSSPGCSSPIPGVEYVINADVCLTDMNEFVQDGADWLSSMDRSGQTFLLYSYNKSGVCSGKSTTATRYVDGQCAETPSFLELNATYSQISITDSPSYSSDSIVINQYSQNSSGCDQSNLLYSIIYNSGFEMNDASTEQKLTFFCKDGRPWQKSCKYVSFCFIGPIDLSCGYGNQNRVVYCTSDNSSNSNSNSNSN